jgi:signal transduction histidine kinase
LAFSAGAYRFLSDRIVADTRSAFLAASQQIQREFDEQFSDYDLTLNAMRAFVSHSEYLTSEHFSRFIKHFSVQGRLKAISAYMYAECRREDVSPVKRRPPVERAFTTATYRPSATTNSRPVDVIAFVEPRHHNDWMLGMDMRALGYSTSIDQPRNHDDTTSNGHSADFLDSQTLGLRLAVYKDDANTVTTPRERLIGSVGIRVSMIAAMRAALPSDVAGKIRVQITSPHDESVSGASQTTTSRIARLADSSTVFPAVAISLDDRSASSLTTTVEKNVGGQRLRFDYVGNPASLSSPIYRALPSVVFILGAVVSILLGALIAALVRSRDKLERAVIRRTLELDTKNRQLRNQIGKQTRLERELVNIVDEERKRLGRELHDNVGQLLTAVSFLAQSLYKKIGSCEASLAGHVSKIEQHLGEAISHVRLLAKAVYPLQMDAGHLAVALAQLLHDVDEVYGVRCVLDWDGKWNLDDASAVHIYRIVQEAVRNSIHHGAASEVTIRISVANGKPIMQIIDNGLGFDPAAQDEKPGLGLQVMRHRCNLMGVDFSIARGSSAGSIISIG